MKQLLETLANSVESQQWNWSFDWIDFILNENVEARH